MIEIGSNALFISIHFGISMWWYSSSDAVVVKELSLCIFAIVFSRVMCARGGFLRLRFGIVSRTFCLVCVACGVW